MPRDTVKEKSFPVGLFILISLMILIGGLVWMRNVFTRPAYHFTVFYNDPDRVNEGISVYYRGMQVGRVDDVRLDRDFSHTLVGIAITEEGLKLPSNAEIKIRIEGITGQRYVEIDPPPRNAPISGYIADGSVVQGKDNVTLEKLQEQLNRIAEQRTVEKLLVSSQKTMGTMEVAAKQFLAFTQDARGFLGNTQAPTRRSIEQFERSARAFEQVAAAIRNENLPGKATQAFGSLQTASDKFGNASESISNQLVGSNLIPTLTQTVGTIGQGAEEALGSFRSASEQFGQTVSSVGEELTPSAQKPGVRIEPSGPIAVAPVLSGSARVQGRPAGGGIFGGVASAVQQIEQTAARFDCVGSRLDHMLSERFLGFKLFFGQPGNDTDCNAVKQ